MPRMLLLFAFGERFMVTAGIAERAAHPITHMSFVKKGFPAMVTTVSLALLWLVLRFLLLGSAGG
jgi:hypothetical protein